MLFYDLYEGMKLMTDKNYFAWMLRIWQPGESDDQDWRASLEDPHNREQLGFDSIEALYGYFQNLIFKSSTDSESNDEQLDQSR